jgi:hypothetical protein
MAQQVWWDGRGLLFRPPLRFMGTRIPMQYFPKNSDFTTITGDKYSNGKIEQSA